MPNPRFSTPAVDNSDRFDTPIPSSIKANKTDGIINSWIFYGTGNGTTEEPEHRLMRAILLDAIDCALRPARAAKGAAKAKLLAQLWIEDEETDGDEAPFSFNGICQTLGLDPSYVRKELFRQDRELLPVHKAKHRS